ncbi:MAG: tetratricopeptide repeat protein [Gammaproteobacteria bacterium]|nr:tetratricopeptide repeat protein [Gammaproteobacteria bacterium]
MADKQSTGLNQQLASIYQRIRQDQAEQALPDIRTLLAAWPQSADVHHLAALAYKAMRQDKQAIEFFLQALNLNKLQPEVHNNLANLYKSKGMYVDAEKHYRLAISLQPGFVSALRNLALCLSSRSEYQLAIKTFTSLLSLKPDDVSALSGLADCYRESGATQAAEQTYRKALALAPEHLNAWHNLGLTHHLKGELEEALGCYRKAFAIAPDRPEVLQSLALSLHEAGATAEAMSLFTDYLEKHPESVVTHERFNEMLWETEFDGQFGTSYLKAIEKLPELLEIRLSFISQLFRAGQNDFASLAVDEAALLFDESHELLSLKGQIQAQALDYAGATESLAASLERQFSKDAAQQLTKLYIIQEHYVKAQDLLDRLFAADPDCQLNWALQSLVWRLCGDERYAWLNDYDRLVKPFQLETPPGYASLQDFLEAVSSVLQNMHRTQHAPLQQTLRHGTQTPARLLHNPHPVLVGLQAEIRKVVQRYIDSLPEDVANKSSHPLLRRKTGNFEFAGSWSVKLHPQGFHVNHVHPAGWLSSSCYISIPQSMDGDSSGQQGCIKFGESPLQLGDREVVEMIIKPEPGMVVLFPSYMWHGTYPFSGESNEYRLTAPFDVAPA